MPEILRQANVAILLVVVAAGTWASVVSAQTDTLRVGAIVDWPPHYAFDAREPPRGFSIDVMDAVALRAGLTVEYVPFPTFVDAQAALRAGEIDVIPSLGVAAAREFGFTSPISTMDIALFIRASSPAVRELADLAGKPVGVVVSNLGDSIVAEAEGVQRVAFEGVREAIFRLLAGDLEGVVYPAPVVWHLAREAGIDGQLAQVDPPLMEVKRAMAVAPGRDALLARLDSAVRAYKGSEEYRAVYSRWHDPPTPYWTAARVLGAIAGLLLLVGVGVAIWRIRVARAFHRELSSRERTFRGLVEGLSDCVVVVDPAGRLEYVSPRCDPMFGAPPSGWPGNPAERLLGDAADDLNDTGERREVVLSRTDGSTFEAEVRAAPYLRAGAPAGRLLTISDVSERRRREERIRFQARLLEVVGEAVIATDLGGRVLFWNRFAERLYGWSAEEALGRPITELTTPAQETSHAEAIMDRLRAGKSWAGEFTVRRRDGSTFPALVTNAPILDEDGGLIGVVGVSSDLTARKELEEQLRSAQRMEALGRLAGGVAHDFNNLLTVITANTGLALESIGPDHPVRQELDEVRGAAGRASELTTQLLAYSRRQLLRPRVVDPGAVLGDIEKMLRRLLGAHIRLAVRCDPDIWTVKVDPGQFGQVILNLAVNARDAMPGGGTLRIALRNRKVEEAEVVEMEVADTGTGIPEEDLEHIFEPFFTTKAPGAGTGLGMATVYGIVRQSDGQIEVDSTVGVGTTIRVRIPRTREAPEPAADAPAPPPPADHDATILVAEDDDAVLSVVRRVLERARYRVVGASSPGQALERIDELGSVDLLITDVVMPGGSGIDLVRAVRARNGHTPVLYMTGYAPEETALGTGDADDPILAKPFVLDQLLHEVRRLLHSPGAPGR